MPANIATFSNNQLQPAQHPDVARIDAGEFGANLTLAAGTVLGKKTADGLLYAYASGNADGTQVAVGLLKYSINTDGSGKVYLGGSSTQGPYNPPLNSAPYYIAGVFDTADLTGWDATAKSTLNARTLANGFVDIPM